MEQQSYRNMSKSACWPPQNAFYRVFFESLNGEFFDKKFSFVILHELAKFLYQAVFTFQVI